MRLHHLFKLSGICLVFALAFYVTLSVLTPAYQAESAPAVQQKQRLAQ